MGKCLKFFSKKLGVERGGLLYFRGCFEGRVRVACRLLYSIFNVGRGLLYFREGINVWWNSIF